MLKGFAVHPFVFVLAAWLWPSDTAAAQDSMQAARVLNVYLDAISFGSAPTFGRPLPDSIFECVSETGTGPVLAAARARVMRLQSRGDYFVATLSVVSAATVTRQAGEGNPWELKLGSRSDSVIVSVSKEPGDSSAWWNVCPNFEGGSLEFVNRQAIARWDSAGKLVWHDHASLARLNRLADSLRRRLARER